MLSTLMNYLYFSGCLAEIGGSFANEALMIAERPITVEILILLLRSMVALMHTPET